ncbi:MAG: PDZ domain-containing protein [Polyangia bacterium]
MMRSLFFVSLVLAATSSRAAEPMPPQRLHVLMINGGGDRENNFASHLSHLRQLADLLERAKVPREHIFVLASDGSNPAPDLAVREPEPEGTWLLEGTAVGELLHHTTSFENSTLAGYDLRPATRAELRRTFGELKKRLQPGDTLLVFVTDHGTANPRDPLDNRISLWGANESLSVRDLRALLAGLPSQVRVVMLMSQCYSGGFAYLYDGGARGQLPTGAACGYFSSTADRPAYGCYPEVRGAEAVGHAFEFLQAFAHNGGFPSAHASIVLSDQSPDVPLRSSEVFLDEILLRAAQAKHADENKFVDEILAKAWAGKGFAAEHERADRLADEFGLPRLREFSLAEINQRGEELAAFLDGLEAHAKAWKTALGDLNQARLDKFLSARPGWAARLALPALRKLGPAQRRTLVVEFLREYVPLAEADGRQSPRLQRLIEATAGLDEIAYRAEVRLAALLRTRTLLLAVAGRYYLQTEGKPKEVAASAALEGCENFNLALAPTGSARPTIKPALAGLDTDRQAAARAQPAWLGFVFEPVAPARRKRLGLPEAAVRVVSVVANSPASRAGMRSGDILVGAAGEPFASQNPVRPAVVLASIGTEWSLDVQRGSTKLVLRVRPEPAPNSR